METPTTANIQTLLGDASLFREACYIDGAWLAPTAGPRIAVDDPATGAIIGQVPNLGAAETRHAVNAAAAALPAWRALTGKARSAILRRWFDLTMANLEDLARLMTLEQGKPLVESRGEVVYGASFIEWFAEEAKRVYGDTLPASAHDKRLFVLKQPIGVVGCITPWNFPIAMVTRKVAPALAAGCTVVLKPAEQTPFSALALAALGERAGIPKGVFNVITGDAPPIGAELTSNRAVRKISFTGSTEVGRLLMAHSAGTIKKLSLELGGNAPFIVFDDADVDAAVQGALASKYRNSGQTCICANRLYVQAPVYDEFATKLAQAVDALKVGRGFDHGITQGPLIDAAAVEKVERHVADALAKGASLLRGAPRANGRFFSPAVLRDATPDMLIATEETFGPVAPLFKFTTEAEAIALANDTEYGLAAYFYGRDVARVWRVAEALEAGMISVNTGAFTTEVAPFGGIKQSGLGREGSRYGIDEYLELKYVCLGGLSEVVL
ncbi:MAG: NAD-dependent succinate-semialdehyde dehydrogenase [Acidobacteriaceae bacterium]|jgi:succinate-semialdehyde dehydrogenase/glutarate-semialdehyde dehydrogenase|nr:NAD-dependent succinate-semialdehyde dehydrogenase [Acidobacteriaceae bacterium]